MAKKTAKCKRIKRAICVKKIQLRCQQHSSILFRKLYKQVGSSNRVTGYIFAFRGTRLILSLARESKWKSILCGGTQPGQILRIARPRQGFLYVQMYIWAGSFSFSRVRDWRGVGVNALRMHPCMRRHLVQPPPCSPQSVVRSPSSLFSHPPSWFPALWSLVRGCGAGIQFMCEIWRRTPFTLRYLAFLRSFLCLQLSLPVSFAAVCGQPATCGTKLKAFACSTSNLNESCGTLIHCSCTGHNLRGVGDAPSSNAHLLSEAQRLHHWWEKSIDAIAEDIIIYLKISIFHPSNGMLFFYFPRIEHTTDIAGQNNDMATIGDLSMISPPTSSISNDQDPFGQLPPLPPPLRSTQVLQPLSVFPGARHLFWNFSRYFTIF